MELPLLSLRMDSMTVRVQPTVDSPHVSEPTGQFVSSRNQNQTLPQELTWLALSKIIEFRNRRLVRQASTDLDLAVDCHIQCESGMPLEANDRWTDALL